MHEVLYQAIAVYHSIFQRQVRFWYKLLCHKGNIPEVGNVRNTVTQIQRPRKLHLGSAPKKPTHHRQALCYINEKCSNAT